MTNNEIKVLEFVRKNPSCCVKDLEAAGFNAKTVSNILAKRSDLFLRKESYTPSGSRYYLYWLDEGQASSINLPKAVKSPIVNHPIMQAFYGMTA